MPRPRQYHSRPAQTCPESHRSRGLRRVHGEEAWNYFMQRAPLDSEADLISALANDFASDNYNFRNLVKQIITQEYIQSERFGGGPIMRSLT